MRRKKFHRKPYKNNRERNQTSFGMNHDKMKALEALFKGMTPQDIIAELNSTWIDARYRLVVIGQDNIICDDIVCFKDWEVQDG